MQGEHGRRWVRAGFVWMQDAFGWRTSTLWTGLGIVVVSVPIIVFTPNAPETYALLPNADRPCQATPAAPGARQGGALESPSR